MKHIHTDSELYSRGAATLLATWEEDARGARRAALERFPGVAAAVFPHEPERTFFNNALLDRGLTSVERQGALDALEAAYAAAGVDRFAAWVHESDRAMQTDLERRGYRFDTTTRAMGIALADARLEQPRIDFAPPDWHEHLRVNELPTDFLARADPAAYRIAIARLDGENVATAIAFQLDGDCGIYNVGTLEHARRRGLASGVTSALLRDALEDGCTTASLQATPMAERLYATLGFRDLGLFFEYVPAGASGSIRGGGTENPMAQTESNCTKPQVSRMKPRRTEAGETRAGGRIAGLRRLCRSNPRGAGGARGGGRRPRCLRRLVDRQHAVRDDSASMRSTAMTGSPSFV